MLRMYAVHIIRTFCETHTFYNGSRCTNRDQHASRLKPCAAASEEGDDECDASRGEQQRVCRYEAVLRHQGRVSGISQPQPKARTQNSASA